MADSMQSLKDQGGKEDRMSQHALVLQSDFGLDDGAVNAMYGVAYSVDSSIRIFDLTHNIPVFHIWEASYRLLQSVSYWPEGTVFVHEDSAFRPIRNGLQQPIGSFPNVKNGNVVRQIKNPN